MKLHKKIPAGILALATLSITTSCNASLTHKVNCELAIYQCDLNHDGQLTKITYKGNEYDENHLTWANSYDFLMEQTADAELLNEFVEKMNIEEPNEEYARDLARYEILHEAEDLLMQTWCPLPLYNYKDPFLLKSNISGLVCSGLGYKFFYNLKDSNDPKRDNFQVIVGSKAATLDPNKNSTVEAAIMVMQTMMGMKRWVFDPKGTSKFDCKTDDACGVSQKIINEDGSITWKMYVGYYEPYDASKHVGKETITFDDKTYAYISPIKWSDGNELLPTDFVFSWNRASNKNAGTSFCEMFQSIEGYKTWHDTDSDKITVETYESNGMSGLKAHDKGDETSSLPYFEAHLTQDVSYWDELLTFSAFMPLPRNAMIYIDSDGKRKIDEGWWSGTQTSPTKDHGRYFATIGPMKFNKIDNTEGGTIQLTRYDDFKCYNYEFYSTAENYGFNTKDLTFKLLDDDTNMLTSYKTDSNVVFIDAIAAGSMDDVKKTMSDQYHVIDQIALYYYLFNVNDNVFDLDCNVNKSEEEKEWLRAKLRKTMVLLVNRNDICTNIGKADQTPSSGFVSNGVIEKVCPRRGDATKGEDENAIYAIKDDAGLPIKKDWQTRNFYREELFDKGYKRFNRFEERDNSLYKKSDENPNGYDFNTGYFATYEGLDHDKDKKHYDEQVAKVMDENINLAIKSAQEAGIHYDENSGKFTDFPEIKLTMNVGTGHEQVAERMQYYYSLFGISLKVETQEWNSFCAAKKSGNFAFARNGWVADYTDPKTYLDVCQSINGNNEMQLGKPIEEYGAYIHISR